LTGDDVLAHLDAANVVRGARHELRHEEVRLVSDLPSCRLLLSLAAVLVSLLDVVGEDRPDECVVAPLHELDEVRVDDVTVALTKPFGFVRHLSCVVHDLEACKKEETKTEYTIKKDVVRKERGQHCFFCAES
jgi:hypothetical protein